MTDLFSSMGVDDGTAKEPRSNAHLPLLPTAKLPLSNIENNTNFDAELSTGSFFTARQDPHVQPDALTRERILEGLNQPQSEAVQHIGTPLLVMAGAGSGKTRVLTRRIAYLLATGLARPHEILAITFTNKAAAEMRQRVSSLIGPAAHGMWVSTFHSACVRILREQAENIGIKRGFTIYDAADAKALISRICKEQNIDSKRFPAKAFAGKISKLKNELIDVDTYASSAPTDPLSALCVQVYRAYQNQLRMNMAMDFDDLIMQTVHMLQAFRQIGDQYKRRFRYILVDEYQDTNPAQYSLIRELTGALTETNTTTHQNFTGTDLPTEASSSTVNLPGAGLTVVGDSDQSIYAFRGATIRNIEEFEKDFPSARTIYLEQNYRSTGNILAAANAIINASPCRRKKKLWTDSGQGEKISLYAADNERDEARFILGQIENMHLSGVNYADMAVFYRTNAQSRSLEEMMVRSNVPYRVVGGTRFYERREVKDAIAYLYAAANLDDDVNLRRIFNVPKRGLGDKTQAALAAYAAGRGISFGQAVKDIAQVVNSADTSDGDSSFGKTPDFPSLSKRALNSVADFWKLLQNMIEMDARGETMDEILSYVLEESGYLFTLRSSLDPQDIPRVDNLEQLHNVAAEFSASEPTARLSDFLERISLVADSDQLPDQGSGQVTFMTVHTAKGLEFPIVFVTGMEDGVFPHLRSFDQNADLEEERRLAYVAVTRARQRLFLTRAAVRSQWGSEVDYPPSRFLDDIPKELLEVLRQTATVERYRSLSVGRWDSPTPSGSTLRSTGRGGARAYLSAHDADGFGFGRSNGRAAGRYVDRVKSRSFGDGGLRTASSLNGSTSEGGKGRGRSSNRGSKGEPLLELKLGQNVVHDLYGPGKVVGLDGEGNNAAAKVKFSNGSVKKLLLRFAPLSAVDNE